MQLRIEANIVELWGCAIYVEAFGVALWCEWEATAYAKLPKHQRWAIERDAGETFLYAGRLYATWAKMRQRDAHSAA